MGKATRWFRSVLGLKCSSDSHKSNNNKKIRKWSFVKSYREKHQTLNHAMPLKLTTATPTIYTGAIAAVKIQSAFRGYLARRALRALKGLVRLQALVRGHIVRRRTAEWFRQMQALLSAQARARAGRFQVSDSPNSSGKSSHLSNPGPATPEKFEYNIRARSLNYYQPSVYERNCSYPHGSIIDGQDRCLEVDSGKSHTVPKRKNAMPSNQHSLIRDHDSLTMSKDSGTRFSVPSYYSCEVQYSCPFNFSNKVDESPFCTATNSPQIFSASSRGASSRRSPFTPTKSDVSRSYLSGYSDCPSYMAYTECSRAKVRSLSAPKQRPQYERSTSTKRHSIHGFAETKTSSEKLSSLQKSFTTKAYPGSGRLDRLGMPVRGDGFGFRY